MVVTVNLFPKGFQEFAKLIVMEVEYPEGNPCPAVSTPLPLQTGSPTVNDGIAAPGIPEVTVNGMGAPAGEQSNEVAPHTSSLEREIEASSIKLCGYLCKLGGYLKNWKSRWFTYEEGKCQLFYYRTSQDVNPLGRIELHNATFGYPLQADRGTFQIQTPERTYILKAVNHQTMMYWLQQLQLKRWQNRDCPVTESAQTCAGGQTQCAEDFLPVMKTPTGLVGEEAACLPAPQRHNFSNVSFKHPLTEIQNSVHSLRLNRLSQELIRSEEQQEPTGSETSTKRSQDTPASPLPAVAILLADSRKKALSLSPTVRCRKKKSTSSATMPADWRQIGTDRNSCLQHEVFSLTQEVKAQKELVWLLHKALEAAQQEKRTCTQFLSAEGEQERLELLRHRERHVADLGSQLEALRGHKETLQHGLAQKDAHIAELQEHVVLMMERNHAKQEVILKLSEQVGAQPAPVDAEMLWHQQKEVENLKDDIEAYKIQNKFLNSEIYQLTRLWRNSSEQGKNLMVKCAYLEAKNCQVESRYLRVLRTLQECNGLDNVQQEALKRLIEDALQGDVADGLKLNPVKEYDEYGFKVISDYEVEDMRLLAKIQALEIRSNNLLQQEAADRPLLGRWAQYMSGWPLGELAASPELKALLRAGVPREYRRQVWRWLVQVRTLSLRERFPHRYQEMCAKSQTSQHPAYRQIQLDLHRTLTSNRHFSSPSNPAVQQLHRILLAFSWQNPTIGYCQGLNRLAAIALLVLQSEEDAFWCLVAVVETIMPQDYYSKNLIASQVDQRVLKDFMVEKMPRLMAHFEEHNIDVSLITFNWFLVVFVECLASDILLRVWDAFLYEGTKVIFRYALAIFKYKEEDILKIRDNVEIYQYLRFFTKTISDCRKLTNIAFNEMNPFPMKQLRARRALHLERLQAELSELQRIQEEFVAESAEREDKDLDEDEDACPRPESGEFH